MRILKVFMLFIIISLIQISCPGPGIEPDDSIDEGENDDIPEILTKIDWVISKLSG